MKKLITITLIIALIALSTYVIAGNPQLDASGKCPSGCMPGKIEVGTLTGVNYCATCALKQELGAPANCKTYGHHHAFKVISMIDGCGEVCKDFDGKTLHYIENDKSIDLVKGHHDENMKITGKVYLASNMLEVDSFEAIN